MLGWTAYLRPIISESRGKEFSDGGAQDAAPEGQGTFSSSRVGRAAALERRLPAARSQKCGTPTLGGGPRSIRILLGGAIPEIDSRIG